MASYTFKWPHPANEVFVTGTFDNWAKTERLEKVGDAFEKHVTLSNLGDKIQYKFVVDGTWTTDHLAPSETDSSGNVNNILLPEHLSAAHPTISSVGPEATTAALAGGVPLEKGLSSDLPGQFPITPANEPAESQTFSVNPIPASSGAGNPVNLAPGEKVPEPSSYNSNTLTSNVKLDQESYEKSGSDIPNFPTARDQTVSVNPIPATAGAGNPIKLAPGEPVPEPRTYTIGTPLSTVRTDKESYEKSGSTAPVLPPVLDSQEQKEAAGASIFMPPVGGTMIPESSLPMGDQATSLGDPTISSVGPQSTTAQLAGQQPILPRGVPEVVGESQTAASVPPEAASSATAVQDKAQVESELKQSVPEATPTSESGSKSKDGIVGAVVGGAAAAGAAVAGTTYASKHKNEDPTISSVGPQSTTAQLAGQQPIRTKETANGVPEVVKESQEQAHASPEASANPEAVKEKTAMEAELEKKVTATDATGAPAPSSSAALSSTAPAATKDSLQAATGTSSRDVSPGTKVDGAADTTAAPSTPKKTVAQNAMKGTPDRTADTPSPSDSKKSKKKGFFGKLKDKLKN